MGFLGSDGRKLGSFLDAMDVLDGMDVALDSSRAPAERQLARHVDRAKC